jgi:Nucleotidyltransferase of unknown function (DUF6036)
VSERAFTRARILSALEALGEELTREGVRGQIFIVGGAAMALAYSTRRVTKDIEAVFEPKSSIYSAAAKVAQELGLPEDWLNDAVKGFMPSGADEHPRPIPDIRGIEVTAASPRYLLAMKLMAMRFGEDDEDIEILLRECGVQSADEALDLLKHIYPLQEPGPKTRFFLEELLGSTPSR